MYIIFIVFILFSIGCSHKSEQEPRDFDNDNKNLGEELIKNDYLTYANSESLEALKKDIIDAYYFYNEETNKIIHIDAEELVEYSFDFFLPNLKRILHLRDYSLNVSLTSNYEMTNEIFINGDLVKLYTKSELNSGEFWDIGPRNFFKSINKLLEEHDLDEKFLFSI